MSKHVSRKSRWIEISAKHHKTSCGEVKINLKGKWDAFVKYKSLVKDSNGVKRCADTVVFCGEYKRAREAMMAVEDKAIQLNKQSDVEIVLDDSLL